jgi:hypothetical protein
MLANGATLENCLNMATCEFSPQNMMTFSKLSRKRALKNSHRVFFFLSPQCENSKKKKKKKKNTFFCQIYTKLRKVSNLPKEKKSLLHV